MFLFQVYFPLLKGDSPRKGKIFDPSPKAQKKKKPPHIRKENFFDPPWKGKKYSYRQDWLF
jgi:hypothetical protein